MNLLENIKTYWFKLMARQLRQPSGILANMTGRSMNKANKLLYHLTLNNLDVRENHKVLEIGFGNGKYFATLNSMAQNLSIYGIEHSPDMVKNAKSKFKKLISSNVITVDVGSSDKLPFENDYFDSIYCINVIYFWENPAQHLQEIKRVLKPGGTFCIGFRPKQNLTTFEFTQFGFNLFSEDELKVIVSENGFEFIKTENGKDLEKTMKQENSPFESVCLVCKKAFHT